jgi:hypothetical protein
VRFYQRDVDVIITGSDNGWSIVASHGNNSLFLGVNYPISAPIEKGTAQLVQRIIAPNFGGIAFVSPTNSCCGVKFQNVTWR